MKTIIIGGGAAGMMAAHFAAEKGDEVILIEKNEKLGKKIYITGKGRCNLTNDCEFDEFMNNIVNNGRFLMSSIRSFTPQDIMEFFEAHRLKLKTERGNRVFPLSDKSSDVIKTLADTIQKDGVEIRLNEKVFEILENNVAVNFVVTDKNKYACDKVIVCTGGYSYRSTGSDGDGYRFAKDLGHSVVAPKPALVPMLTEGGFADLAGLTLKNVTLKVYYNEKLIVNEFGEMLFTHVGISGPIVLTASSRINSLDFKQIKVYIDLKPALDFETLDARVQRDFVKHTKKQLKNALGDLLPSSLIEPVIKQSGVSGEKKVDDIKKEERKKLVETLKNFKVKFRALADFNEAIVTSGGVSVKEVDPKTMESKKVKGLYFAGEVLDVDALTGGFNLQIAWATGAKAGKS